MAGNLIHDKFWVDKCVYHDAEKKFHESLAKLHKNGQKCEEGKSGQEVNNKKVKEKNSKAQAKSQKNSEPKSNLEVKNMKHNSSSGDSNSNKRGSFETIENKEDEFTSEKEESISEKKSKQKDAKEKKSKSDKKSKKKCKDENRGGGVGLANASQESCPKTTLAEEVAKARQHIKSSLESMEGHSGLGVNPSSSEARLTSVVERLENLFKCLEKRVEALEKKCATCPPGNTCVGQSQTAATKTSVGQCQTVAAKTAVGQSQTKTAKAEDDDVDLFGSDSEEEDEETKKIKEQRLAEYAAKKSKKAAVIAKSNIILDVKPWDDETDMKLMEVEVRKIEMDGLIWGASKLVPLAYGIHKLQISCVVEDDKVSVDQLIEAIEGIEDHVQSVDIAAFNKV